jgi:hypothetical protein
VPRTDKTGFPTPAFGPFILWDDPVGGIMKQNDGSIKKGSTPLSDRPFLRRLSKRMRQSGEFKELEGKIYELIYKVIKTKEGMQIFRKLTPGRYRLRELIIDFAKDHKKSTLDLYLDLLFTYLNLLTDLSIEIFFRKLEDGRFQILGEDMAFDTGRLSVWDVKNKEVNFRMGKVSETDPQVKEIIVLGYPFDEVEINDSTEYIFQPEGLSQMLGKVSKMFPAILKYVHRNGTKRLFVSLPEYLDIRTFFEEFKSLLSKIHHDFFQTNYRGAPKTKPDQLEFLKKIWQTKCENKGLSKNQQAKILSEELNNQSDGVKLEPITIVRHYLPLINKEKRGKK